MSLSAFHPAVQSWFNHQFQHGATPTQQAAWPAIRSGQHVLIAAPTGAGKTLAAFLAAIDSLVQQSAAGTLTHVTQVVYVSPLKALSNDIQRNLEQPLTAIHQLLAATGNAHAIRAQVRTGDTPHSERTAMLKKPPHILVTTPESLYLLLTSVAGRKLLATTRSVIIDEIHAVANSKRGAHLALSLERLDALCGTRIQRIGLSATQKPIATVAHFLTGSHDLNDCTVIDSGHVRARDLALVLPDTPLEAVMSNETWQNLYDKLTALISAHHTTLVFANTRRLVERVARFLSERLGAEQVAAHHGSLAKEQRLAAEQKLKQGQLRVLVASASLELGIDIGKVELVCQLGSPRAIATFLQRVGRANHAVDGIPKGRLFPLSRDELIECTALLDAVRLGELDRLLIPQQPLDVLAQQIIAEVAAQEYAETALFALVCRAWPYRDLTRAQFDQVLHMLAEGFATRRGRQSAYLHRDAVHQRVRARRGARLTALTCGGAIPDNADYQVILEPSELLIGTLHEDFAIESQAGDIFQLGNTSYRILRIEAGRVRVADAQGQPPTLPFWLGEAPARTDELSAAVSRLRTKLDALLNPNQTDYIETCIQRLCTDHDLTLEAARQIVEYLAAAKAMLGQLPTQQCLVFERFFDESGGMQLVIHAPFGARINRAFGLSLRKRFCRSFNFELQAAATEDAIILSLGETHSFALAEVAHYLNSHSVQTVLTQAVLDAPLFTTRWRWNTSIALAVKRARAGKRTPAPLQRMAAEDLVAVVFPDQLACLENIQGDREIPDHPLVWQTLHDCLHEAMDIEGLITLLTHIEQGQVAVLARDLPHPSPLAQEILNARPYAFLDDAPLEERRTQAVASRRWLDPKTAAEFGTLNTQAIAQVCTEAWPEVRNADELHDALMSLHLCTATEGMQHEWSNHMDALVQAQRATYMQQADQCFWIAIERLPLLQTLYSTAVFAPPLTPPTTFATQTWETETACIELLRGRLQATGPVTATQLAALLQLPLENIQTSLIALETQGFALQGQFTPGQSAVEWCERRLLARIHRYTLHTLRAEIEPVSNTDFMRFLFSWQSVAQPIHPASTAALLKVLEQLEGFTAPATAWEQALLPARLQDYDPQWLDTACRSGRIIWCRLNAAKSAIATPVRATPIALLPRKHKHVWQDLTPHNIAMTERSHAAQTIYHHLHAHGASFFTDLAHDTRLLPTQVEAGLGELVAAGLVSADSFSGLRALLPAAKQKHRAIRLKRSLHTSLDEAGRWSLIAPTHEPSLEVKQQTLEHIALSLLRRYGVVFRQVLTPELKQLPPWYELLRVLRQLEAQGIARGGRFVAGTVGEQFALPDAVSSLRAIRKQALTGQLCALSAVDPLNLSGIILPGPRVPATANNRLLFQDGVLIAARIAGNIQFYKQLTPSEAWTVRNALLRQGPATTPTTQITPTQVMH